MLKNNGALHTLAGFENEYEDGEGYFFNFILSNGTRSTQRDERYPTNYTYMIPKDALNKIRRVSIHYNNLIGGFSFFDKDGALLWKIGNTANQYLEKETVMLEENEVIVGVVAKLSPYSESRYTSF